MDRNRAQRMIQAAAWRRHLTEIGAESTEDFEIWLAADVANPAAWRQAQKSWSLFSEHASSRELVALRRTALGNAHAASRKRSSIGLAAGNRVRRAAAAGAAVAIVAVLALSSLNRAQRYETSAGERRSITLSDGSKITLDARSLIQVAYTKQARELKLIRGQARFDVARDITRPFSVVAGGQKVVALATAFNVDLQGPKVTVTLIEGRVAVMSESDHPSKAPDDAVELNIGEQLSVSTHAAPSIAAVNIERATAWERGQLVFDSEPLSNVVERMNRYTAQTIEIEDPQTASLRINGVFNAGDVSAFVSTITHYLPIVAESRDNGIIKLRQR